MDYSYMKLKQIFAEIIKHKDLNRPKNTQIIKTGQFKDFSFEIAIPGKNVINDKLLCVLIMKPINSFQYYNEIEIIKDSIPFYVHGDKSIKNNDFAYQALTHNISSQKDLDKCNKIWKIILSIRDELFEKYIKNYEFTNLANV